MGRYVDYEALYQDTLLRLDGEEKQTRCDVSAYCTTGIPDKY